jgi:hypothetical protein
MVILPLLFLAAMATALPISDPVEPHLAQAWTAFSKGDGLPNQVGFESYLYEDEKTPGGIRGHIFNYTSEGINCVKIELSSNVRGALQGKFYIKCDSVDCCYETPSGTGQPVRPDVKQWDIARNSLFSKVKYVGVEDTQDLDGDVKNAEVWSERDHLPLTKLGVNYTYYITRNGADIITHKIHFSAPGAIGEILYGNFTVVKDIESFRKAFTIPDMCYPQGSGKGHALNCGNKAREWEKKYFKHSALVGPKAGRELHPQDACSVCEETVKAIISTGAGAGCGAACAASGCEPCIPFCSAICAEIAGGETNEHSICQAIHLC